MVKAARIPRMRRPLLAVCSVYIAIIFLILKLYGMESPELPFSDKESIRAWGVVARKELKADSEGEDVLVCYIDNYTDGEVYRLQCYMDDGNEPDTGAEVLVTGTVRLWQSATNPGEFDSAEYYRVLGIACRVYNAKIEVNDGGCDALKEWIYHLRIRLAEVLSDCLNSEDAGVMRAMLLGDKSAMDQDLKALYQRSGIIHILAISGLHISLIGMGLFKLTCRTGMPRMAAAILSTAVMLSYSELCGASSSAIRALIMFFIHITAIVLGKSYDMLTALALAAALLVTEQPLYLNYSGFLLSFLAVLGIGVIAPLITPRVFLDYVPDRRDRPLKRKAKQVAASSLSGFFSSLGVTLVTLPVYMQSFHTFPVYSVFLNVLILPLMSIVLGLGLLCMMTGLFSISLGAAAGMGDHVLLELFKHLCLQEDGIPGAVWVTGHAGVGQIVVYYIMLTVFAVTVYIIRESGAVRNRRGLKAADSRGIVILRTVGVVYIACAIMILSFRPKTELKITILDVGQGDGIVIEGAGVNIMIDGGSTSRRGVGNYVLLPFLEYEGIARLDAAVITHEDEDHINGVLEILENESSPVKIDNLVLPAINESTRGDNYIKLLTAAGEAGVPVSYISRGEKLTEGGLELVCLGPGKGMSGAEPNAASTLLYLSYGDFSALFTGDVEGDGQDALKACLRSMGSASDVDLLKVAHHGSKYTTDESFLGLTKPEAALISCGRNNRYGHPHEELVQRLEDIGASIFTTAQGGAITCLSDGTGIEINTFVK